MSTKKIALIAPDVATAPGASWGTMLIAYAYVPTFVFSCPRWHAAYYFNASTNVTSWDKPLAPAAAAPAAPPKPAAAPEPAAAAPAAAAPSGGGDRGGFLAEIAAGKKLKKTAPPVEKGPAGAGVVKSEQNHFSRLPQKGRLFSLFCVLPKRALAKLAPLSRSAFTVPVFVLRGLTSPRALSGMSGNSQGAPITPPPL